MGHFARLDKNNVVTQVIRVSNDIITSEQAGIDFCKNLYQTDDDFVQTSYNTEMGEHLLGGTPLRKNFAGIGSIYYASRDAFYIQKPYESWVLDESTCTWVAPIDEPTIKNNEVYSWDEENTTWIENPVEIP